MRPDALLAVAAMAAVTYLTRVGGIWAGRGPLRERIASPAIARWLEHLPGAVLVSIIAPTVARGGPADALAAAVAIVVAARTRSAWATLAVGVVAALVLRRVLGR